MKLSRLIRDLTVLQEELEEEAKLDPNVNTNPLIVLASDEEGNGFYELNELELDYGVSVANEEDWLILWPAGFDLQEER